MLLFIIIDDYPMVQSGISALLTSRFEDAQCIVCSSLEEAADPLREHAPSIILLDLSLPGIKGIQAIKFLRHAYPDIPVLVFSASEEAGILQRCMEAGAAGFLCKNKPDHEIVTVVQNILDNNAYYSQTRMGLSNKRLSQILLADKLTNRQIEVLKLMRQGDRNKVIAFKLGCSENTVKVHSRSIFRILEVNNRQKAVEEALSLGIFD